MGTIFARTYPNLTYSNKNYKNEKTPEETDSGAILGPFLNGKLPSEIRVILCRNFENHIWQKNFKKGGQSKRKILLSWNFI